MTSNTEIKLEKMKLEDDTDERIYRIDETFPRNDNLEYLPEEILLPIFNKINDIGLVNLATTSSRFETIAKVVFEERYADKYFEIEGESQHNQKQYSAKFEFFGPFILAIRANHIKDIDKYHWLAKILGKYAKNLRKLYFNKCDFINAYDLLCQHTEISHLTLDGSTGDCIRLPEYRNLEKLELSNSKFFCVESLKKVLRINPWLESLIVRHVEYYGVLRHAEQYLPLQSVMEIVYKHLKGLKEFHLLISPKYFGGYIPDNQIDKFVNSVKGLESLGLSVGAPSELFRLLRHKCEHIKRMEIGLSRAHFVDAMEELKLFDKVEDLSLLGKSIRGELESLVGRLPRLRILNLYDPTMSLFHIDKILPYLSVCEKLEKLVVGMNMRPLRRCGDEEIEDALLNFNVNFHEKFLKAIRNPNVRLELVEENELLGVVTASEIIWRNKIVHHVGFDPIYSQSDITLLDLADPDEISSIDQEVPFNKILEFLDLSSLFSLSNACRKSKQLVESFVQRRSEKHHKFVITDEFSINFIGLRAFGRYINNLEVCLHHGASAQLQYTVEEYFKNLQKLYFRVNSRHDAHNFIFPQVRHYVFYCAYESNCNLTDFSETYPRLEVLEFKSVVRLRTGDEHQPHSFKNLQLLKFKPLDESQVAFAKELLEKRGTQVIIDE